MKLAFALVALAPATALAFAAPTHAGLTERAALASSLEQVLVASLGHPLGLFEPLALDRGAKDDARLRRRLAALDPAGGYAPDDGRQTALGWLAAGAVLEGIPAARERAHFYDPLHDRGLDTDARLGRRVASAGPGIASLRGLLAGAQAEGFAAPAWVTAPRQENDWGLARYLDERELSAIAPTAAERDGALARALVAAGSILHVLQDMADPSHVRNDAAAALSPAGGPLARLAREQYGRSGVPAAAGPAPSAVHLGELFHDVAHKGLADLTARGYFSPNTLPGSGAPYPRPNPGAPPPTRESGYLAGRDVAHLVSYQRTADGIRYRLDERCEADYAAALLPEAARFTRAALDLLFRGQLAVTRAADGVVAAAPTIRLGAGRAALYADDANGSRRLLLAKQLAGAAAGTVLVRAPLPAWARHVTALFRGVDGNGEPLVITQETAL